MNTTKTQLIIMGSLVVIVIILITYSKTNLSQQDNMSTAQEQISKPITIPADTPLITTPPVKSPAPTTNQNKTTSPSVANPQTSTPTKPTTDYIESYVSAFISALNSLYDSTQELKNISAQYPANDQTVNLMTAMLQNDSDYENAIIQLQPYIHDSDEAIGATAIDLYADTLKLKNDNLTMLNMFRDATPETFNQQQGDYDAAQVSADQSILQKDLTTNKIILIIAVAVIQIPQTPLVSPATGPIQYAISPTQRKELLGDIQTDFGTALSTDYGSNIYLVAVKAIQLSLTFDTYEQYKSALASM